MKTINDFRIYLQSKLVVIRVNMKQRDGEGVDDALARGDGLYAEQETIKGVLYLLDGVQDLSGLQEVVSARLPDAKGTELDELTTAQRLIAEFEKREPL